MLPKLYYDRPKRVWRLILEDSNERALRNSQKFLCESGRNECQNRLLQSINNIYRESDEEDGSMVLVIKIIEVRGDAFIYLDIAKSVDLR